MRVESNERNFICFLIFALIVTDHHALVTGALVLTPMPPIDTIDWMHFLPLLACLDELVCWSSNQIITSLRHFSFSFSFL